MRLIDTCIYKQANIHGLTNEINVRQKQARDKEVIIEVEDLFLFLAFKT